MAQWQQYVAVRLTVTGRPFPDLDHTRVLSYGRLWLRECFLNSTHKIYLLAVQCFFLYNERRKKYIIFKINQESSDFLSVFKKNYDSMSFLYSSLSVFYNKKILLKPAKYILKLGDINKKTNSSALRL